MEKIKLLLYCTKSRYRLFYDYIDNKYRYGLEGKKDKFNAFNGKIVAECEFEVEEIEPYQSQTPFGEIQLCYKTKTCHYDKLLYEAKLSYGGIENYLKCNIGYAIHIKNLNIFDKPRELNEYYNSKDYDKTWQPIIKAPQNMMYADYINIEKNIFRPYILISIHPEWLVKILNGEKTIEVRKKVLKEML